MVISNNGRILCVGWYYFTRVVTCVMIVMISTGCKSLVPQPGDLQKGYSLFRSVCPPLPKGTQTPEREETSLSAIRKLLEYERNPSSRPATMSMNGLGVKDLETLLMIKDDFCVHPGYPAIAERGLLFEIFDGYVGLFTALLANTISKHALEPVLNKLPDTIPSAGKSVDPPIIPAVRKDNLQLIDSLIEVAYHGDKKTVDVYYATTRQRSSENAETYPNLVYTHETGSLAYGICSVSIPDNHRKGDIERPLVSRLPWRDPWLEKKFEDPKKHMTMFSVKELDAKEFSDRLRLSHPKEAFIYIHGIGNTFEQACLRAGQMANDLEFQGAPFIFSWPAHRNLQQYTADQAAIDRSRPYLEAFIEFVSNAAQVDTLHLIAHSLGNRGLIYAIDDLWKVNRREPKRIKRFQELVLIAPDFDTATFWNLAKGISESTHRVTIYASSNDIALQVSKNHNDGHRLGEAGPDLFRMDRFDSVDASDVDTSFFSLHHTPHEKPIVVRDISQLLSGWPASRRSNLRSKVDHRSPIPYYYIFPGLYD